MTKQLRRIAILGAGPSGLAAAFALAKTGEYDIHIYQSGWRAGGKCATGREKENLRTIQNGSHYVFGCCYNAFQLIREAYAVLSEHDPSGKFGTFKEEFVSRNLLVSKQTYDREPKHERDDRQGDWFRYLPQNMSLPGRDGKLPTPFDYATMAFQFGAGALIDFLTAVTHWHSEHDRFVGARICLKLLPLCPFERSLYARAVQTSLKPARWLVDQALWPALAGAWRVSKTASVLLVPQAVLERAEETYHASLKASAKAVKWTVKGLLSLSRKRGVCFSQWMQRNLVLAELAATLVSGYIEDRLFEPGGLERIDNIDFREWLKLHGASDLTAYSALITTWYDAIVSYKDGRQRQADCSAGVAIQAILRALLTYKGAFAFQMRAEVGDSFIAPIVAALDVQGVHFHFFSRVDKVVVDSQQRVSSIVIEEQCNHPPKSTEWFVEVPDHAKPNGPRRWAWPDQPHCSRCATANPPLDSYYAPVSGARRTLYARSIAGHSDAEAFDAVIAALPHGVMQDVLVDEQGKSYSGRSSDWRACFDNIRFTESQAIRMWFNLPLSAAKRGARSLGWTHDSPILSGFDWPHSTWEDNSQARDIHNFPPTELPLTIATLFGPLETGKDNPRKLQYKQQQQAIADAAAQMFLKVPLAKLWPGLEDQQKAIDWPAFIDLNKGMGEARFKWQRVVANVGPNESYILAEHGALKHRLRTDETGIENLFIAGDWTRNGVEVGSMEGAVMSGLKAARAVHGSADPIIGGDDFDRGTLLNGKV